MKKKILVTGGTGFLGREFLNLFNCDYDIYSVVRKPASVPGVHEIIADLSEDFSTVNFPTEIDAVVHLAQSEHFRKFPEKAVDIFRVNTYSTMMLLDYAQKAGSKKFVLASTGSVYGGSESVITEETPVRPDSFYAESKLAAERLVLAHEKFLAPVIFRYFFIYGPGQENRLIPGLIQKVLEEKPVTLAGERGLRLNPLYVSDAAGMLHAAIQSASGGIFNAAGEKPSDLREVCETIAKLCAKTPRFETGPAVQNHFGTDISKLRNQFRFKPAFSLEQGLKRTLETARPSLSH